jgi:hypothetical protein
METTSGQTPYRSRRVQDIIDDAEDREQSVFVERLKKVVFHSGVEGAVPNRRAWRAPSSPQRVAVWWVFGADNGESPGLSKAGSFAKAAPKSWR